MARKPKADEDALESLAGQCAAIETLLICVIWQDDRLESVRTMFRRAVDNFIAGSDEEGLPEAFRVGFVLRATEMVQLLADQSDPDEPAANDDSM